MWHRIVKQFKENFAGPKRRKITVGLMCVVCNEEKGLEDFLSYHAPFFDEVVIVDQESIDRTPQIGVSMPSLIGGWL